MFCSWFVRLSTTGGFTSWCVMNITYIYFRTCLLVYCFGGIRTIFLGRGMLAQGFDLTANSYHNRFQPYVAYWGAGWTIFFILINGFKVFWHFNTTDFLTACKHFLICRDGVFWLTYRKDINIPIFFVLYFGYKFTKKTSFWKPEEMDFVTVRCFLVGISPDC